MHKRWFSRALQSVVDARGCLVVGEIEKHVPFLTRRFFIAHSVPSTVVRGGHAHKTIEQFMVCVTGSVAVMLDDGTNRERIVLDSALKGLYVPPMVWDVQCDWSEGAVLLVLASKVFSEADYIRDYDKFQSFLGAFN